MQNEKIENVDLNQKPDDTSYLDDVEIDELRKNLVEEIVSDCPQYSDPTDASDASKDEFYYTAAPVYSYRELLKSTRQNYKVKGYWFDVNTFENLIDCYTPKQMVPLILRCTEADLDRFCKVVYGMKYDDTYKILIGITDSFMRKSFKGLSQMGNPTAIKVVAEHFMDLKEQDQKDGINITIYNDLKEGDE